MRLPANRHGGLCGKTEAIPGKGAGRHAGGKVPDAALR